MIDPRVIAAIHRDLLEGGVESVPNELAADVVRIMTRHRIERYMIPSDAPGLAGNPGASPKQLRLVEAFANSYWRGRDIGMPHRIIAASGANQSGKTEAIGGMCFCQHLRDHALDGDVYWIIAQSAETVRDIPAKTLWNFLPREMFGSQTYSPRTGFGVIQTLRLKLPHGGKCEVHFKAEEQEIGKFESSRVNGVWWTECRSEHVFEAIQPRLAARQGFLLMDFVPIEAWHADRIWESGNPRVYHERFCTMDNAHNMPPGAIEAMRASMSLQAAAWRIDGKDRVVQDVVYPQFDPQKHVVPSTFRPAPDWPKWRSLDYGYRHPTVVLWWTMTPAHVAVCYREMYATESTVTENAERIKAMSGDEVYRMRQVVVDPAIYAVTQANGRSIAQEYESCGVPCTPAERTNLIGIKAQVDEIRMWFEAGRLRFSAACPKVIRDHTRWKYKVQSDGSIMPSEPFAEPNKDGCDATRYFIGLRPRFISGEPYVDPTE